MAVTELAGAEFTGERVIPEQVDADLLNEHVARYRFANGFIAGRTARPRVLDAGCGSGYGTAELTNAEAITAADISADAVEYARRKYGREGVRFLRASCEAMPFAGESFDLVVAFEVIEHLEQWQDLISEANRVLAAGGTLLVSTPNRDYYAESRGDAGPNPFHVHEFEYEEFREALTAVFPHVRIWTQNHAGAIVFAPQEGATARASLDAQANHDTKGANFFVAACSRTPFAVAADIYAWLPSSANVLRERERHIAKLSGELLKKDAWLRESVEAHGTLQENHEALTAELRKQNKWAAELNQKVAHREARIAELQRELDTRLAWIGNLEARLDSAGAELDRRQAEADEERQRAAGEVDRLNGIVTERTQWAQRLDTEIAERNAVIAETRAELRRVAATRWVRTGAKLGLGPDVRSDQ